VGHLGNFGTERTVHEETFGFLGENFRIHPEFTDLGMVDFMLRAETVDEGDEAAAMKLVRHQLTGIVHPDDWERFWALCIAKRQMYVDLMELMKGLVQAMSGRPTRRPSGSEPGRSHKKRKSKGGSSRRERADGVPAERVDQAVRQLERAGRADLALVVVEADEQQRTA